MRTVALALLKARIEALASVNATLRHNSGSVNVHHHLSDARDAWSRGDEAEVERCLALAAGIIARERRWEIEDGA